MFELIGIGKWLNLSQLEQDQYLKKATVEKANSLQKLSPGDGLIKTMELFEVAEDFISKPREDHPIGLAKSLGQFP